MMRCAVLAAVLGGGARAAPTVSTTWHVVQNLDALPNPVPSSFPVSTAATSDACGTTCDKSHPPTTVWVWSPTSQHCYCTTLTSMTMGRASTGDVSACVSTASWCKNVAPPPPSPPHHHPPPSPSPPPSPTKPPLPVTPTREPNMNGRYQLSETKTSNTSKYPDYRDYPGGVEYFDVYSPLISQFYSQVYWKALPPAALPADVVKKFDGRTMAIVGFEVDQVQNPTVPAAGGSAKPGSVDLSVPINVVYNHHFESTMKGKAAKFVKIQLKDGETPQDHGGHGAPNNKETWIVRPADETQELSAHSSTSFGGANGGEYRKSFHGFPPGNAVLLDSPDSFILTPMQIDTWNREKMPMWNETFAPDFVPGPVPRNSWAPTSGPDAIYSGLLECPLTTRVRKVIQANYDVKSSGPACGDMTIQTAPECFQAVAKLLPNTTTTTSTVDSKSSLPAGCSIERDSSGKIDITFNKVQAGGISSTTCGGTSSVVSGTTQSLVQLHVSMDKSAEEVRITMAGPSAVWYGCGFNASEMSDEPWAIIVDGHGAVTERKLVDQKAGSLLTTTVKVLSNTVTDGLRTVVMSRPMKGAGAEYYSFDYTGPSTVPFINAVGSTPTFSYHKAKSPASITLLPVDASACVCSGSKLTFGDGSCKGEISYVPTAQKEDTGTGAVNFNNRCAPDPASQLLSQHNPTCDLRTYLGGQLSCHHMWSLLDADQEIPWTDKPLNYHFKWRFWYQEYREDGGKKSHKSIGGGWGSNLGAGGGGLGAEFDVPKCAEGVPGCSKGADGSWVHTVVGIQKPSVHPGSQLVAAHMHCHAPTCLSMSIANNETGEMICEQRPTYGGQNPANNHNKYRRGTTRASGERFEESGYIAVPPCLWGSAEHGLDPPPNLEGVTLRIVKRSNATYGHHGEMAHGQFYYAS